MSREYFLSPFHFPSFISYRTLMFFSLVIIAIQEAIVIFQVFFHLPRGIGKNLGRWEWEERWRAKNVKPTLLQMCSFVGLKNSQETPLGKVKYFPPVVTRHPDSHVLLCEPFSGMSHPRDVSQPRAGETNDERLRKISTIFPSQVALFEYFWAGIKSKYKVRKRKKKKARRKEQ